MTKWIGQPGQIARSIVLEANLPGGGGIPVGNDCDPVVLVG